MQKKTSLKWSIYARYLGEVSLNGLPYWLTGIAWQKESVKLYIEVSIKVWKGVPGPQKSVFWT